MNLLAFLKLRKSRTTSFQRCGDSEYRDDHGRSKPWADSPGSTMPLFEHASSSRFFTSPLISVAERIRNYSVHSSSD